MLPSPQLLAVLSSRRKLETFVAIFVTPKLSLYSTLHPYLPALQNKQEVLILDSFL